MLAKCSNPSCVARFLHLDDGKLFRLIRVSDPNRLEYFWVCNSCSLTMTLRLAEDGSVIALPLPKPLQGFPDAVDYRCSCREKGLLLRSVTVPLPESGKDRTGTRVKVRSHAA